MILLKPISSILKFVAKTDLMNAAWRRHRSCHHRWFFKFSCAIRQTQRNTFLRRYFSYVSILLSNGNEKSQSGKRLRTYATILLMLMFSEVVKK